MALSRPREKPGAKRTVGGAGEYMPNVAVLYKNQKTGEGSSVPGLERFRLGAGMERAGRNHRCRETGLGFL